MARLSSILNSNFSRILQKCVLFILIVFLLDLLLSSILSYQFFHGQGKNTPINYIMKQRSDIMIFGASRASHHYIPNIIQKETGYSVFNAGDDSKNATYLLGLLELVLTQHIPKIVIYEISDFSRSLDNGTTDLYPFYYTNRDVHRILLKRDHNAIIHFSMHLYAYNQKLYRLLVDSISKSKPDEDGYRPLNGTIMEEEITQFMNNKDSRTEPVFDPVTYSNFVEFIKLCKRQNIQLVLVNTPFYFGESANFVTRIDSLAQTYDIPFFNYYNDPHFLNNKKLFKDAGHLNNDGATLFSEIFGKDLQNYLSERKFH
jgi:hypothetical protein